MFTNVTLRESPTWALSSEIHRHQARSSALIATARSAMNVSSVSPERWLTVQVTLARYARDTASEVSLTVPTRAVVRVARFNLQGLALNLTTTLHGAARWTLALGPPSEWAPCPDGSAKATTRTS